MSQKVIIASDEQYEVMQDWVARRVSSCRASVFRTRVDEEALWNIYLGTIPADIRQHYNCSACRHFIRRYGGLVLIGADGTVESLLWGGYVVPEPFETVRAALQRYVESQSVSGVFLWDHDGASWGQAQTGEWTHLHGECGRSHESRVMRPHEQMADKLQDFIILQRGLREFPRAALEQAVRVLEADALGRSEKAEGIARWLLDLSVRLEKSPAAVRRNLIWLAVAEAPPGYCHVRSTMISTLLEDIIGGLSFERISERWAKKMHPLRYQRPQAPPRAQAIENAEKIVAELGIESALRRRYARLDDVLQKLWIPQPQGTGEMPHGGVFDHLRQSEVKELQLPSATMTWEKFVERVLPFALQIEVRVPVTGPYYGLVTATDPEAPPIVQWDGLDGLPRNPVSWYFYNRSSSAGQWGLHSGSWVSTTCIFISPHRWQRPEFFDHHGDHVFFALEGARDSRNESLGLFPEILKKELRPVRSVIEAHSERMKLDGEEEANANGLAYNRQGSWSIPLRVRTERGVDLYNLDRWE